MIVEIVAVYFFVRCAANLARAIERRGDVLNYVSSSDPHWYRGWSRTLRLLVASRHGPNFRQRLPMAFEGETPNRRRFSEA